MCKTNNTTTSGLIGYYQAKNSLEMSHKDYLA